MRNESVKDKLSDCPKIPEAKKLSKIKYFEGTFDTVTEAFYLKLGLVIFRLKNDGKSNFIVGLIDEEGNKNVFVNQIGKYDGSTSQTIIKEGYYRIEVTLGSSFTGGGFSSSANWNISVEQ